MILKKDMLEKVPDFYRRLKWFQKYREGNRQYLAIEEINEGNDILLSLVPKSKLEKLLNSLLDENEFCSMIQMLALQLWRAMEPPTRDKVPRATR